MIKLCKKKKKHSKNRWMNMKKLKKKLKRKSKNLYKQKIIKN